MHNNCIKCDNLGECIYETKDTCKENEYWSDVSLKCILNC